MNWFPFCRECKREKRERKISLAHCLPDTLPPQEEFQQSARSEALSQPYACKLRTARCRSVARRHSCHRLACCPSGQKCAPGQQGSCSCTRGRRTLLKTCAHRCVAAAAASRRRCRLLLLLLRGHLGRPPLVQSWRCGSRALPGGKEGGDEGIETENYHSQSKLWQSASSPFLESSESHPGRQRLEVMALKKGLDQVPLY